MTDANEDRLEEIKKDWDYERDKGRTCVSTWEEKTTIQWLIEEVGRLRDENHRLLKLEPDERAVKEWAKCEMQVEQLTKENASLKNCADSWCAEYKKEQVTSNLNKMVIKDGDATIAKLKAQNAELKQKLAEAESFEKKLQDHDPVWYGYVKRILK